MARRQYQSLVLESQYRLFDNLSVNGHWTVRLENDGNYEGEETNQPGDISAIGDYPEAFPEHRYYPLGRLQNFQRHRLRAWTIYNHLGRAGDVSVSGLWRYEGSRAFSHGIRNFSTTPQQRATLQAAGYPDAPTQTHLYFGGERGTGRFPGYGLVDVSINYNIPVFRTLRPWIEVDVYNALDNRTLIAWNTNITPDPNSPLDEFGLPHVQDGGWIQVLGRDPHSCFAAIGIRHPVPNARSVTFRPGAACFRLNSAARTIRSTRSTVAGSNPAATIADADSCRSMWRCRIGSSTSYGGSES